jgi:cell division protein FtsX
VGAVAVGFSFRYIDELRVRAAIRTFVRADLLPVSAFEFALFVVLSSVDHLALREAFAPNNPVFWFILQMGLVIGFFAAWPASSWVIRRGVRVELRRIHS